MADPISDDVRALISTLLALLTEHEIVGTLVLTWPGASCTVSLLPKSEVIKLLRTEANFLEVDQGYGERVVVVQLPKDDSNVS